MHSFVRPARTLLIAVALVSTAAPVFAGAAQTAVLHQYVGVWKGAGQMSGSDAGPVSCRMTMKPSGSKVSFIGRCNFDGTNQSFNGSLAYNESTKRYEAASKSGVATASGKNGNLVFAMSEQTSRASGSSVLSLSRGAIQLDFTVTETRGGRVTTAHVDFARS